MFRRQLLKLAAAAGALGPGALAALLDELARESSYHVDTADLTDLGPAALDRLHGEVRDLAAGYVVDPPIPLVARMALAQGEVLGYLQGRLRPSQALDLHLLAGELGVLLANASLDLGRRPAAVEQARAAWGHGQLAGHDGLSACARAMEASIAFWSGRYREAATLAGAGLQHSPNGSATARLANIQAGALAALGQRGEAREALALAHAAFTSDVDTLGEAVGGEFAFQPARLHSGRARAFNALGDHSLAAAEAGRSVELWLGTAPGERSYGSLALALIEQAAGHVHAGEVGGAADALAPVLGLSSSHHIELYDSGLARVGRLLGSPALQGHESVALAESIESFRTGLPRALGA